MSNIQVPASLIEQVGTGPDTHGIIGKRVRITYDPAAGMPTELRAIFGIPATPVGAEGTAIHVSESGEVWVDFGDNEAFRKTGPEQVRVAGLGPVGGDVNIGPQMFEVIGEVSDTFYVPGPGTLQ